MWDFSSQIVFNNILVPHFYHYHRASFHHLFGICYLVYQIPLLPSNQLLLSIWYIKYQIRYHFYHWTSFPHIFGIWYLVYQIPNTIPLLPSNQLLPSVRTQSFHVPVIQFTTSHSLRDTIRYHKLGTFKLAQYQQQTFDIFYSVSRN